MRETTAGQGQGQEQEQARRSIAELLAGCWIGLDWRFIYLFARSHACSRLKKLECSSSLLRIEMDDDRYGTVCGGDEDE